MLVRFVVSNFLSFKEETEFNLLVGNFKTHKHHVLSDGKVNVLRSSAIYGANGAGKSNLIKAIDQLDEMVHKGFVPASLFHKYFKLAEGQEKLPISFEIEVLIEKKLYAYGLELADGAVKEEWLVEVGITKEDKTIFHRTRDQLGKYSIEVSNSLLRKAKTRLLFELMEENLLKPDDLLLSRADILKIRPIQELNDWFLQKLFIIYPKRKPLGLISKISSDHTFLSFANSLLKTFDTGVSAINLEELPAEKYFAKFPSELMDSIQEKLNAGEEVFVGSRESEVLLKIDNGELKVQRLVASHIDANGNSISLPIVEESDGTQRLLDFLPAMDMLLNSDVTILIDEIDNSIHPKLLRAFIEKLTLEESMSGQFIFSTHESILLDLKMFRQDEIWFVEKDQVSHASKLYPLSEFKPRPDLDLRKGYLNGRFGAVPSTIALEQLNWLGTHAEA